MFLWVTGRAMELARDCFRIWGYKRPPAAMRMLSWCCAVALTFGALDGLMHMFEPCYVCQGIPHNPTKSLLGGIR